MFNNNNINLKSMKDFKRFEEVKSYFVKKGYKASKQFVNSNSSFLEIILRLH